MTITAEEPRAVVLAQETPPPPAAPAAPRYALSVATGLAIAAATMLMGGLLGYYLALRQAAETWPPQGVVIPNVALVATYGALLLSSLTAQWSVSALTSRDRRHLYLAIAMTVLLGGAFINGLTFCWARLALVAGTGFEYADIVYAITVTHLLLVVTAMVVYVLVGFRVLAGQASDRQRELVVCATAWWHFVVVVGLIVWWTLWFAERVL